MAFCQLENIETELIENVKNREATVIGSLLGRDGTHSWTKKMHRAFSVLSTCQNPLKTSMVEVCGEADLCYLIWDPIDSQKTGLHEGETEAESDPGPGKTVR